MYWYVLVWSFSIARVACWRVGVSSPMDPDLGRTEFLDYDPDSACGRRTTSTLLGKVLVSERRDQWGLVATGFLLELPHLFGMFTSF